MKIPSIFKKKKRIEFTLNNLFGIIEPSEVSLENGNIDKFNKSIIIRQGVAVRDNKIFWGRVIEEIPFSDEAVDSLEKIREIPVIERTFRKPEFFDEETFGGIIN